MFYSFYTDCLNKQMNIILKLLGFILLILSIYTIYHNLISNSQIIEIEDELNQFEYSLNIHERDMSENEKIKEKFNTNGSIDKKIENLKHRCGDLCNTDKNVTKNEGDFLGHIKSNV